MTKQNATDKASGAVLRLDELQQNQVKPTTTTTQQENGGTVRRGGSTPSRVRAGHGRFQLGEITTRRRAGRPRSLDRIGCEGHCRRNSPSRLRLRISTRAHRYAERLLAKDRAGDGKSGVDAISEA